MAEPNPTQPSKPLRLPYNPGSKSYLVAQMLLEGKKDDETICKEVGVKRKTLWTVKSRLRRSGFIDSENITPQDAPHEMPSANKQPNSNIEAPSSTPHSQQLVEEVARRVLELLRNENPQRSTRPAEVLPLEAEDVEVVGEKVNYKVALNPEIFWRYSVFKAEAERRGRQWNGSFSDFLDFATKDILAVYGIHPTVLSMKGKKLMVELPVEVEREQA